MTVLSFKDDKIIWPFPNSRQTTWKPIITVPIVSMLKQKLSINRWLAAVAQFSLCIHRLDVLEELVKTIKTDNIFLYVSDKYFIWNGTVYSLVHAKDTIKYLLLETSTKTWSNVDNRV